MEDDLPLPAEIATVAPIFVTLLREYIDRTDRDSYELFENLFVGLLRQVPNIQAEHFFFCLRQVTGSDDAAKIFSNMWKFERIISVSYTDTGSEVYNYGRN